MHTRLRRVQLLLLHRAMKPEIESVSVPNEARGEGKTQMDRKAMLLAFYKCACMYS